MTQESDIAKEKLRETGKQMRLVDASVRLSAIRKCIGPDCIDKVGDSLDTVIKLIDEEIEITHKKREGMG